MARSREYKDIEDIKAEIRRRGQRISALSEALGFAGASLSARWKRDRAWPELDTRLAEFLGTDRQHLFPSHYHPDGKPKSPTRVLKTTRPYGPGFCQKSRRDLAA